MLEDDIIRSISRTFGIHDGPWRLYSVRDNYVFTTTKRLAKAAYKPGGDARLSTGVHTAATLATQGLPVVAPLLPYPVHEEFGRVTLWPLIEHVPVDPRELAGPPARSLGTALAQLSLAQMAAPDWDPFARVTPRLTISTFPSQTIDRARSAAALLQEAVSSLKEELVFSHGDAHPANALFFDDDTLALIDFDYATMAPPGWDIACLWVSMVFENNNQEGFDTAQEAYTTAGGVPSEDLEVLAMLRVLLGATFHMTMPYDLENIMEVEERLDIIEDWLDLRWLPLQDMLSRVAGPITVVGTRLVENTGRS